MNTNNSQQDTNGSNDGFDPFSSSYGEGGDDTTQSQWLSVPGGWMSNHANEEQETKGQDFAGTGDVTLQTGSNFSQTGEQTGSGAGLSKPYKLQIGDNGSRQDGNADFLQPAPLSLSTGVPSTPASSSPSTPPPANPEDWIYYDPSGGKTGGNGDAFSQRPFQIGTGARQNSQGRDGFGLNPNANGVPLPPAPAGTFETVPGSILGSNRGNDHDYSLDNPRPLGISMDTAVSPKKSDIANAKFGFDLLRMQANPSPVFDQRSEKNISTLLPKVQDLARQHLYEAQKAGIDLRIISGKRSYADQDALYAQGRTVPGPIVTNARGGESNHNFGTAYDVGVFRNGHYIEEGPEYDRAAAIGKRLGLEWGGNWTPKKVDRPHFQFTNGLTPAQMREKVRTGQSILPD